MQFTNQNICDISQKIFRNMVKNDFLSNLAKSFWSYRGKIISWAKVLR